MWSFIGSRSLILIALFLLLAIYGCASKQGDNGEIVVLNNKSSSAPGELLSHEQAVLDSTGSIDKNVPEKTMADVKEYYSYLLRDGRKNVCAFSRRSEQYLAYARKVFRDRGMPEDLANLAIVESGYRPDAKSHAGAAGAWQFMPQTGLNYGLTQDWFQDERLDPYKATEAAADYLQKLYNNFGDWPTAIAAYNAGEGKMSRALSGTGGKDFYEAASLNHVLDEKTKLKTETTQYVPRFLAVTKIMRNLSQLGFDPIEPEKSSPVLRYTVDPGMDLKDFSRACKLNWSEFAEYNPHHKRNITCTDRQTYVYVPARVEKLAADYLASASKPSYAGWKPTKVSSGMDSLEKISKRANISLAQLRAANPETGRLKPGQIILVPPRVDMLAKAVATSKKLPMDKPVAAASAHVVQANETLYSIAKKYNVSVEQLRSYNNIGEKGILKMGGTLQIPDGAKRAVAGSSGQLGKKRNRYVVQAKDNLWNIAKRYKISVDKLKRINKIDEKSLMPGATIIVAEE